MATIPVGPRKPFTSGKVERICKMAPATLNKIMNKGYLAGRRVPGSRDRRFNRKDVLTFLAEYIIMPMIDVAGKDEAAVKREALALAGKMITDYEATEGMVVHPKKKRKSPPGAMLPSASADNLVLYDRLDRDAKRALQASVAKGNCVLVFIASEAKANKALLRRVHAVLTNRGYSPFFLTGGFAAGLVLADLPEHCGVGMVVKAMQTLPDGFVRMLRPTVGQTPDWLAVMQSTSSMDRILLLPPPHRGADATTTTHRSKQRRQHVEAARFRLIMLRQGAQIVEVPARVRDCK